MHQAPNFFAQHAFFLGCLGNRLGGNRLRRLQHRQPVRALRIRLLAQTQPAARIAFAGQQGIRKTLRLAKSIGAL